jgi:hypothetical protein
MAIEIGSEIQKTSEMNERLWNDPSWRQLRLYRRPDGQARRLDDLLKPEFAIFSATHATVSAISEASLSNWQALGGERFVIATSGESSKRAGVVTRC